MLRSRKERDCQLLQGPELDIHQLVTVYTVDNLVKAEIIQNALHDEGIRCFLDGENQAGETGLAALEIRIEVPVADADRARGFIESHERRVKS
jgi:Putative prokaryotic signal transducing protein